VVTIANQEFQLEPCKLRKWLELEDVKFRISEAVENKDRNDLVNLIYLYISTAIGLDTNIMSTLPYKEVVEAFEEISKANQINIDLPFMRTPVGKHEKEGYEYDYRSWWSWAFLFANRIGWSIEYIANLNVPDALYLYQEHLIKEYREQDWDWTLSERFVGYDTMTKKAKINALPKPAWMLAKPIKPVKPTKIPKFMMPSGIIVSWKDYAKPK